MEHYLAIGLVVVAFGYGFWVGLNILRGNAWAIDIAESLAWLDPSLAHLKARDRLGLKPEPRTPEPDHPVSEDDPKDDERLAA